MNCKVCNRELQSLSKNVKSCGGNDIFILPADHNYSIIINDDGTLFSEEIMLYNIANNIGYLVDVNYEGQLPLPKGKGLYLPPKAEIHWNCFR
jgi:hypothetical protein